MTDNSQNETNLPRPSRSGAEDPDGWTADDLAPKDWMLDLMLTWWHGTRDEDRGAFTITLQSNGAVVSGTAISKFEWQDALLQSLDEAGAHHVDILRDGIRQREDMIAAKWDEREEAGFDGGKRNFIHLRDVKILGTEAQVRLWRGKLADVTGWSLGGWQKAEPAGDGE